MKKKNNYGILIFISILIFIVLLCIYNINSIEPFTNMDSNKNIKVNTINLHTNIKNEMKLYDDVIICGNAPIKDNSNIDNFKTIVRINCYRIIEKDYQKNAGKLCNLFVWCGNKEDQIKKVIDKYPDSYHLTYNSNFSDKLKKYTKNAYIIDNDSEYKCDWDANKCLNLVNLSHNKLKNYNNQRSYLTTGVKVIMWFIANNFKNITISGYTLDNKDIISKNNKLYRETGHTKNNGDIKEVGCCHDLFEEVNILNDLINNDVIKYLK